MKYCYFLIFIFLFSCNDSIPKELTADDYFEWLDEHARFSVREKKYANLLIKANYLPSDFLAYKELMSINSDKVAVFDSLKMNYKNSINFKLTITAQDNQNLMMMGVANKQEYNARVDYLNFDINDFISLKYDEKTYHPKLSHMESYNELNGKIVFHLVFPAPETMALKAEGEEPGQSIILSFEDKIWGSGMNHFTYKLNDLQNIPMLRIL